MTHKSLELHAQEYLDIIPASDRKDIGTVVVGRTHDGRVDIETSIYVGSTFKAKYCQMPLPEGYAWAQKDLRDVVNDNGQDAIKHDTSLAKAIQLCQKHGEVIQVCKKDVVNYISPDDVTLDMRFAFCWDAQMSDYAETLLFTPFPYAKVVEKRTEAIWKPLENHLGKELCSEFMYMVGYKLDSNIIVHTYKHRASRMYVNLSADGRSWEYNAQEDGYRELLRQSGLEA